MGEPGRNRLSNENLSVGLRFHLIFLKFYSYLYLEPKKEESLDIAMESHTIERNPSGFITVWDHVCLQSFL